MLFSSTGGKSGVREGTAFIGFFRAMLLEILFEHRNRVCIIIFGKLQSARNKFFFLLSPCSGCYHCWPFFAAVELCGRFFLREMKFLNAAYDSALQWRTFIGLLLIREEPGNVPNVTDALKIGALFK